MKHTPIFAILLVAFAFTSSLYSDDRPNIILLLTDDQNFRSVGYSGNPQVKTPNIDRLANKGTIFESGYTTTSICMASRAQVMTGMYEYKTGCNFSHGPLTRDKWEKSYPVVLRKNGYYTGFVGKFGFAVREEASNSSYHDNDALPIDSFDEWYGWPAQGKYETAENEFVAQYAEKYPHVTRAVGAVSQDFIKNAAKKDKPFLLSVSFKAPHGPMSPDPMFDEIYADTVWAQPDNYDKNGAAHIPEQAKSGRQYLHINDFEPQNYQKTMRKYNQLIYGIDYAVGMIADELERQGIERETVVLFLTDNGYSLGAHGMGGKVLPYEEPSRSPMFIYDPRHPNAGQRHRVNSVTGNIDMAPTIFELAGLPVPSNMDGKSLLPLLDDPNGSVHDSILLIQAWGNAPTHSLAVVTENYKYINWPFSEGMESHEELYHLTTDRLEMRNQADNPEFKNALDQMRKRYDSSLEKWKAESVETGNYPLFAKIYDRSLSWQDKLEAMDDRTRRMYVDWRAADKKLSAPKKKKKKGKDK
ncbi:sulfatase family protein [Pelagicoccus mobilis]|uniref:Sulfatase n=1 Tax=Pelagicoccus mobilis TaxID=415221 RepID=A0A934RTB4_9BACT|nr:sulfatase [Pelagicoccus mobilis]MBK1876058.1 sulfatase [Pelagicoccus mobilis]